MLVILPFQRSVLPSWAHVHLKFILTPILSGQLGLNDQFNHVIINQSLFLLGPKNQALSTELVDNSGQPDSVLENLINGCIGKDFFGLTEITQMAGDVAIDLGTVHVGQLVLDIDPLPPAA